MVLILSSPKTLKLEVDSKDGFFSPSWVYRSEKQWLRYQNHSADSSPITQVNAEKSPETVIARLLIFLNICSSLFPGVCSSRQ